MCWTIAIGVRPLRLASFLQVPKVMTHSMLLRLLVAIAFLGMQLSIGAREAHAKPEFLAEFIAAYPSASRLFTCGTCHFDFNIPTDDLTTGALAAREGEGLKPYGGAVNLSGERHRHPPAVVLACGRADNNRCLE